jgi:beta-glucanase (GH16 family)
MKRVLVGLVLTLSSTLAVIGIVNAPAEASARRVTLQAPQVRQLGQPVVLQGRVVGTAKKVRIERAVSGRWVLVRRAAVRHGHYTATVRQSTGTTRYRAGVLRETTSARTQATYSAARTVQVVKTQYDACGARPAKSDGTLWSCTFDDDFAGSTLDRSKWMPQTNFASGVQAAHACYVDDPSVINVSGGSLNLTLHKVGTPVSCTFGGMSGPTNYVSGSVMTYHLFSQQYGRFEARVKNTATTAPGLHEAFWMWPDDRVASTTVWPYAGEMDVSETYSIYSKLAIPFLHYSADIYGNLVGVNTAWNCAAYRGVWNTYTLEWSASRITIKVNGRTCMTNTSGDPAFQKPYIMALSQMMGTTGNVYDGRAPVPATMNIDYVRAWK